MRCRSRRRGSSERAIIPMGSARSTSSSSYCSSSPICSSLASTPSSETDLPTLMFHVKHARSPTQGIVSRRARGVASAFTGEPGRLLDSEWADHDVPSGLLATRGGLDTFDVGDGVVDELALVGVHRVEFLLAARLDDTLRPPRGRGPRDDLPAACGSPRRPRSPGPAGRGGGRRPCASAPGSLPGSGRDGR